MAKHKEPISVKNMQQPLDVLMTKFGITNAQVVKASTEQLTFKMLQKGREGKPLAPKLQDKILRALQTVKPDLKIRRRELFHYEAGEEFAQQIREAFQAIAQKKVKYPGFVDLLLAAGVNHYAVDIAAGRTTFYGKEQTHIEEGARIGEARPGAYDDVAIKSAITDAQKELIDYPTFLKRMYESGIINYEVNVRERFIRYYGHAQMYKEIIPVTGAEPVQPKVESNPQPKSKPKKAKAVGKTLIKKSRKFVMKHRTKKRSRYRGAV